MDESKQSIGQKMLLFFLYGLVLLMVVFSIVAAKNRGQKGFDGCMQENCETHGEEFCNKPREINNCCLGAGGKIAAENNTLTCIFS